MMMTILTSREKYDTILYSNYLALCIIIYNIINNLLLNSI